MRRYVPEITVGDPLAEERLELLAHWAFDEGSGQVAYDSGPGGYDGYLGSGDTSLHDSPTWWSGDGCLSGSCLQFDGV